MKNDSRETEQAKKEWNGRELETLKLSDISHDFLNISKQQPIKFNVALM
jgi:hypothetical protein